MNITYTPIQVPPMYHKGKCCWNKLLYKVFRGDVRGPRYKCVPYVDECEVSKYTERHYLGNSGHQARTYASA